ncbi:peptidyl-prolyl cis-trans isomerase A (cyclophilin A) [Sphingomonas sp. F9_3S_D5_B_2]
MINRIALLAALLATPALAQVAPPAPPAATGAPAPKDDLVPVALDTSLGRIVIALDRGRAPITTANFLHYVDAHRLDGESFYRAMHVGAGGLIQGGITSDARKLFPPIADEPSSKTGVHNTAGAVSMARGAPGSATADFFILLSDMPSFDAKPSGADPDGYAAFGHVTEGMDIVRQIFAAPVSATKGIGPMKGQMLDPTIKIIKATRVK